MAVAQQKPKVEPIILSQSYFRSVGPRTYAAQVKQAGNGNHFIVLTEGKRDEKTNEVRKTRIFVFSEDFEAFFKMLQETSQFIKANPVSPEVKRKRQQYWAKQNRSESKTSGERPPKQGRNFSPSRPAQASRQQMSQNRRG